MTEVVQVCKRNLCFEQARRLAIPSHRLQIVALDAVAVAVTISKHECSATMPEFPRLAIKMSCLGRRILILRCTT